MYSNLPLERDLVVPSCVAYLLYDSMRACHRFPSFPVSSTGKSTSLVYSSSPIPPLLEKSTKCKASQGDSCVRKTQLGGKRYNGKFRVISILTVSTRVFTFDFAQNFGHFVAPKFLNFRILKFSHNLTEFK